MAISYKALADYQQGNDQTAREDLIYAISLIFDKSNKGEIGLAQFIEEIENNLDEGRAMQNQEPRATQCEECEEEKETVGTSNLCMECLKTCLSLNN